MFYDIFLSLQLKWNIPLLCLFILILLLYGFFLLKFTKKELKTFRPFLFFLGMCLLYLITGTPLSVMSHLLFSTHMLQMSIFYFITPPLLLLGLPDELFLYIKNQKEFIDPILCLVLFSLLLYMYHIPMVLDFVTSQINIHEIYSWVLFALSIIMWIPLTSSPKSSQLNQIQKHSYAMLNVWLITPACILLFFLPIDGGNLLLTNMASLCIPKEYLNELFVPPINIKLDQQLAGITMFISHKAGMSLTNKLESVLNGNK